MQIHVGKMLVEFTSPAETDLDLSGDYFDKTTWFNLEGIKTIPVYLDHGAGIAGKTPIGQAELSLSDKGIGIFATLRVPAVFGKSIRNQLVDKVLSWSSGSNHTVERVQRGRASHLELWPLTDASLVYEPANPGLLAVEMASRAEAQAAYIGLRRVMHEIQRSELGL